MNNAKMRKQTGATGTYQRKKALIMHQGAIGDFLIAVRLIEFCNNNFNRNYSWHYLGKSSHGKLAQKLKLIDSFTDFEYPGWHLLFAPNAAIDEDKRNFFKRFDLILNVITGRNSVFARNIEKFANKPDSQIFHIDPKPNTNINKHYFIYLAEQMKLASAIELPDTALCNFDKDKFQKRSQFAEHILIHPGGSSEKKRWPIEHFITLAKQLQKNGKQIAFLMGHVELEQFSADNIAKLKSLAPVIENCPLDELAEIIANAESYIGNDNGISHIAGALSVETNVIFVRDNWQIFSPIGPNVRIIPAYKYSTEQIIDIILKNL